MSDPGIVLQHDADVPPALVGEWLDERGLGWRLIDVPGAGLPELERAPWLIVLGSHRSTTDLEPAWIPAEIELLGAAVDRRVPTLGICFGGQALALALGGRVEPSVPIEAGWDSGIEVLDDGVPLGPWLNFHLERFTVPPARRCSPARPPARRRSATARTSGSRSTPRRPGDRQRVGTRVRAPASRGRPRGAGPRRRGGARGSAAARLRPLRPLARTPSRGLNARAIRRAQRTRPRRALGPLPPAG